MDVVLVGVIAPEIENHSIAVLREALDAAGFSSAVVPFGGFAAIDRMVEDVLRWSPRICGVSLQTTESTLAALAFTKILRDRGYAGTIVVGGHVATLMADELLAAPAAIDVVVELAGEEALVGLARGLAAEDLPGARTRRGQGRAPIAVKPRAIERRRLGEHLGFGAADLILSRGCAARCGYCCVAAASDRAEEAGDPRHVARDVERIADEIAQAAELGGRAFHVMDDNVLPLDPAQALAWTRSLRARLERHRVPRIAISLQLRADVVTPELADELVELGLVRAYIGIDGYSAQQLRAIGRSAPASAGQRAIDLLSERGVFCVANALIVGPTIRLASIAAEIEALATIERAPVHLLPIEARPGTVYHRRATARGLIEGSPLWPMYRFEDERAYLIGEVLLRLPTRLELRSVPVALYDLGWALGVARRLAPEVELAAAVETYAAATVAWNADQLRILRAAAAAAVRGRDAIEALVAGEAGFVRAHDEALLARCDRALRDVESAMTAARRRPVRAHARGRLLAGVAMSLSLAAACSPGRAPSTADADTHADVMTFDAPACADPARHSKWNPQDEGTCACGDSSVQLTFNDRGEVTAVGAADPPSSAPTPELQRCLLDLLAGYCYPAHAGQTIGFSTCHVWIA